MLLIKYEINTVLNLFIYKYDLYVIYNLSINVNK